MDVSPLLNYGVLGLWTIANLLLIKFYQEKDLRKEVIEKEEKKEYLNIIKENTQIIAIVCEKLNNIERKL